MAFQRHVHEDSSFSSHSSSRLSIPSIWNAYRGEILFVLALVVALLLGGYTSHPGVHLAGATVFVDLAAWRRLRRFTLPLLSLVVVMNVIALVVILVGHDPAELWLAGVYGLYGIFLLLMRRN